MTWGFAKIRNAKKFAEEKKKAEESKPAPVVTPYRHVPKHAATDALHGAHIHKSVEDKQRIYAESSRRRTMINYSRTNSATGTPALTRNSSYQNGYGWTERGDMSLKPGLRRNQSSGVVSGRASRHISPIASSGTSTNSNSSSQDYLEMARPSYVTFPEDNALRNLHHPSGRKVGEAPTRTSPVFSQRPMVAPAAAATAAPEAEKKKKRFSFKRSSK